MKCHFCPSQHSPNWLTLFGKTVPVCSSCKAKMLTPEQEKVTNGDRLLKDREAAGPDPMQEGHA